MAIYKIFGFIGFSSFLSGWMDLPWYSIPFVAMLFGAFYYISSGGWRFIRNICLTLRRDFKGVIALVKVRMLSRQSKNESIPSLFSKIVQRFPNKVAMINAETGESLTFAKTDAIVNQIGNYFLDASYEADDVVALFMESTPTFICHWLGLARVGIISALLNFNLRGESLLHCIRISNAKTIVYSKELADALLEIKEYLDSDMKFFCVGDDDKIADSVNIERIIQSKSASSPNVKAKITLKDKLFYIYTSGTTGLPKAAIIRHWRFLMMAKGIACSFDITNKDICYNSLPLYHSNGGILGAGQMVLTGATLVIRKKFSASRFFDDCIKYKATCTQYIGETCRYLLKQPEKDTDRKHNLRLATGNGLKPQIWEEFKSRFNITQIGEFYGSTEGNSNIVNIDNKSGAVGFNSLVAPWFLPLKLVKVDEVTGDIIRDSNGLAVLCGYNEPGQAVAKIKKGDPFGKFDGYLNPEATKKKLISNVFSQGDLAFLSGDILYQDELGYFYFHDRTGDTFRWKGENVSTSEVEGIISKALHLSDAVVYGVEVPGTDGKAGMVAFFDPQNNIKLGDLVEHLKHALPPYARPVFVRRMKSNAATTSTFKYQKNHLRADGFCPDNMKGDSVYYFDAKHSEYKKVDKSIYEQLTNGKIRL
eukprot:gene15985-17595_t